MEASRDDVRAMVTALFVTNAALDRAKHQKKGASTLSLLQVITATPGIRPSEIASTQDVHPSQVTRQVRELESLGLVQVTADTADKRSCRVTLTTAGSDELQSLTEEGLDRFALFVADLGARRGTDADLAASETGRVQGGSRSPAAASARSSLGPADRVITQA